MAGMSPTQLTLRELRRRGLTTVQVVEHWNPFARRRIDLFGIVDVLAVGEGETIAIQCTSYANVSSRCRKIADSEAIADLRKAGWTVLVQGWRKVKGRWVCREVDVS